MDDNPYQEVTSMTSLNLAIKQKHSGNPHGQVVKDADL